MIFPIENMPAILQWISNIIPARWFIAAVRKLMIEGLDVLHVIKELAILAGMAIFLIAVSVKKFKLRLA
jgi:ABC-2 type transport system permease protein